MGDTQEEILGQQKKEFDSVKQSYQDEMNMFIHAHLRGYDKHGQGRYEVIDDSYYFLFLSFGG